jgi:hypothetical protein
MKRIAAEISWEASRTILKEFNDKYPAVNISFRHDVPWQLYDWVAFGEATVAVTTETG